MNEPYLGYSNAVGLMVHQFHMQEMWYHVAEEFAVVKETLPDGLASFCDCAKDVKRNGVHKYLRLLAQHVYRNKNHKMPKAKSLEDCGDDDVCRVTGTIGFAYFEPSNPKAWDDYKAGLILLGDMNLRDMAIFLYCMLET